MPTLTNVGIHKWYSNNYVPKARWSNKNAIADMMA